MKNDKQKNNNDLKQLEKLLNKVVSCKPKEAPKKPTKQPSKSELEEVYTFDGGRIVVSD